MDGGNGSDVLDGGPGNDKLTGGTGVDLVAYPGTAAVVIDLSGTTDTAKRGGETDTLIGIEGALGSSGDDTFKGDALDQRVPGQGGQGHLSGGSSRDTYDFNDVADSPAGATRDVVTDFVHPRTCSTSPASMPTATRARQPSFPLGRQGDPDRRCPARLFRHRRHDQSCAPAPMPMRHPRSRSSLPAARRLAYAISASEVAAVCAAAEDSPTAQPATSCKPLERHQESRCRWVWCAGRAPTPTVAALRSPMRRRCWSWLGRLHLEGVDPTFLTPGAK